MPDSDTNVGPAVPSASNGPTALFKPGDEPALAVTGRMEMSAPIEQVTTTSDLGTLVGEPVGEIPHEPEAPPAYKAPPLLENVSPFNVPDPHIPTTEYVQVSQANQPGQIGTVATPPILPPSQPAPPSRPGPVGNQAIGPIIRKRPAVAAAAPKPVPPVQPPAAVSPSPASPTKVAIQSPPVMPSSTPPVKAAVLEAPKTPPPPASPPKPFTPIPEPPAPTPAPAPYVAATAVAVAPPATDGTLLKIYSHNTRAVWKARRSTRILYLFGVLGLAIILVGVFLYWLSIGAPKKVQDIPALNSQSSSP